MKSAFLSAAALAAVMGVNASAFANTNLNGVFSGHDAYGDPVVPHADSTDSVIRLSGTVTRASARCGHSEGVFKNILTRISLSPPVQDIYVNDRDRFDSALKQGIEDFEGFVARSNLSTACQYVASMSKTQ